MCHATLSIVDVVDVERGVMALVGRAGAKLFLLGTAGFAAANEDGARDLRAVDGARLLRADANAPVVVAAVELRGVMVEVRGVVRDGARLFLTDAEFEVENVLRLVFRLGMTLVEVSSGLLVVDSAG